LSGRGLCDELITRPEESYRLCCVVVCDLETSRMGAPYVYDISRLRVNPVKLIVSVEQRGSRGIPLLFHLRRRWLGVGGQLHAPAVSPRERYTAPLLLGGVMVTGPVRMGVEKRKLLS